jgi:hypothetical protein
MEQVENHSREIYGQIQQQRPISFRAVIYELYKTVHKSVNMNVMNTWPELGPFLISSGFEI